MKFLKLLLLFFISFSWAQNKFVVADKKKTVIPFQLINNLIFIPLNINGVDLTFLLDSGVKETILFSLEDKEIQFQDTEKIKFSGLGESKDIEGLRSDNNLVKIGKDFTDLKHTVYIILDESINFSSHVGIPVNGIIGYQFFKDHQVQIDFISKKITVFNDESTFNKRKKRFTEFPINLEGNKPYIMAGIEMTNKEVESKMLIDLGNSDAVWLFPKLIKDFVYNRPNIEDYLGQGFNGDIFGKRSRIHRLFLGDFKFEKPLTAMPDEYSIQHLRIVADRKGSIGSDILRRFLVIFDYPEEKIYFRKNKNFSDPFLFNKSGLDIQHTGMTWEEDVMKVESPRNTAPGNEKTNYSATETFRYNFVLKPQYSVSGCRKDSPCATAGMEKGDKIMTINGKKLTNMTLQKINDLLKEDDGTKIKFVIQRRGEQVKFELRLIDPIPYQNEN